ncbi:sigma-70 family RNA polymerase sigma factor [Clostridium manihotivorum]|uniref:Sigma-70 family RNA polymerase sigma factor n=1 Tax=Clostridium manihotivorum TaxID=2320868 RepID=A0A3R5X0J9_9CLOT|nr:sigma-70 family RNA polymerase sigma factor [Clostridium manihotivorum]QAA31326.1 sigma-70 family RNA polymerase sigma factor [Clostridium manihotivorum]
MDYKHIENLVLLCKEDNEEAKETLVSEFNPFIINLCKKSFVSGYEFDDIRNECYKTLFNCIKLYEPEKHRFVAYATNAMKNSVNCLIRKSVRRQLTDGSKVVMLDTNLENIDCCDMNYVEDIICQNQVKSQISSIINTLNEKEKELVLYIFFKGYSMKKYSDFKMIPYYKVVDMKTSILSKLKLAFKVDKYCNFTN